MNWISGEKTVHISIMSLNLLTYVEMLEINFVDKLYLYNIYIILHIFIFI